MDDLISRQAAIEAIGNDVMGGLNYRRILRELPAAQERKRGKWEHGREVSRDYIGDMCVAIHYENWRCSNCNYSVDWGQPMWKYCPNCGADMRAQ